jgi:hypothetical protein
MVATERAEQTGPVRQPAVVDRPSRDAVPIGASAGGIDALPHLPRPGAMGGTRSMLAGQWAPGYRDER